MMTMIDDPSPAEVERWYQEQLRRNRRYRQMLAARSAGKSDIQFTVPAGSKRCLLPGDDVSAARSASKDLRVIGTPLSAQDRQTVAELHRFADNQADAARLADCAAKLAQAEEDARHQLVRTRPPIPATFREVDIRRIRDMSGWELDGKAIDEGARLVVIGINSPDLPGIVKRARDSGKLWFVADSGEFMELRHLAPRPVRWEK